MPMNNKFAKAILITVLIVLVAMPLASCGISSGGGGFDFDEKLSLIGQSKGEVLKLHEDLKYSYDYSGGYYYETSEAEGLLIGFPAVAMIAKGAKSPTDFLDSDECNGIQCNSLWGTTELMLDIKETTPIEEIEKQLGVDFGVIEDSMGMYPDSDLGDGYAEYTGKDGNNYKLVITTNTNGQVEPDHALLVIKK